MDNAKKSALQIAHEARQLQLNVLKQMLTLATSAFGVVAALAWNELIKETIDSYVKPYLPSGSSTLSLLIYAVIVTSLAVFITLNLSRIISKFDDTEEIKK